MIALYFDEFEGGYLKTFDSAREAWQYLEINGGVTDLERVLIVSEEVSPQNLRGLAESEGPLLPDPEKVPRETSSYGTVPLITADYVLKKFESGIMIGEEFGEPKGEVSQITFGERFSK